MLKLIKKARIATEGDTSLEWLKPFMTERKYRKGDKLCSKGDAANEMFLIITGKFPGHRIQRRASAWKSDGRAWLPDAEKSTDAYD